MICETVGGIDRARIWQREGLSKVQGPSLAPCESDGFKSSFPVEIGPFSSLNEAGPVEWMLATFPFQHGQLRLTQGLATPETFFQSGVILGHQFSRDVIADRPKAHHQTLGSSQEERASQAIDSLT